MSRLALDLNRTAFSKNFGDFSVYGTWWHADAGRTQPCLVLLPDLSHLQREEGHRPTPCVVLLDQAWQWAVETGNPAYAASMSHEFARQLGLTHHNQFTVMRVTKAIHDLLGDLVSMPPMPTSEQRTVADAILVDAEGRSRESEIRAYV